MSAQNGKPMRHKHSAHKLRTRLLVLVSAVVLLMSAWVVVGRQLMLLVPEYRHDLELLMEARVKTPLEIGGMSGYMDGALPVFVFNDVRLPSQGEEAPLHIEEVELSVDVIASILQRNLRARRLRVSGIELDLTLDKNGKVHLTGLEGLGSAEDSSENTSQDPPQDSLQSTEKKTPLDTLLDLIYRQKRLVVENARGTLSLPEMPTVKIEDLVAVVVSSGEDHFLSLRARSADRPVLIDVRLSLSGDAHHLAELTGESYVRLEFADVDPWMKAALHAPLQLENLEGTLESWISLRKGVFHQATIRSDLKSVTIAAASLAEPVALADIKVLARASKHEDGYLAQLGGLSFVHNDRKVQLNRIAAGWNGQTGDDLQWQLAARDFLIEPWRKTIAEFPLIWPDALSSVPEKLEQLLPSGEIESLLVRGSSGNIDHFSARFIDLENRAHKKIPSVAGFSGWLSGSLDNGVFMLDSPQMSLDLPHLIYQPMVMSGRGPLHWQKSDDVLNVESGWIHASNQHAGGQAVATVRIQPGVPPELSLLASVQNGQASAAKHYIPLKKLPEPVSQWLNTAFADGQVKSGEVIHEGPIRIDPERQQDRTLQLFFNVENLTLQFLPDWPPARELSLDVTLDGREIRGRNIRGKVMNVQLSGASADIPEYEGADEFPQLIFHSRMQGPASDLQTLFTQTPLKKKLPKELLDWRVSSGAISGNMLLHAPLRANSGAMTVLVNGEMKEAAFSNPQRQLSFDQINGGMSFSLADGVQAPLISARLWEQPLTASVTSQAQRATVVLSGDMPVSTLQSWLEAKWMTPASGIIGYTAKMMMPDEQADMTLSVNTDLSRVAVDLPPPLTKKAGKKQQGFFQLQVKDNRQTISFQDGNQVVGKMRIENGVMERGNIYLGLAGLVELPSEPGVLIRGKTDKLSISPWIDFFSKSQGDELGAQPFPLRKLTLNVAALDLIDMPIADAHLQVLPLQEDWKFTIDSEQLVASLQMPENFTARGSEMLDIHAQHLRINTDTDETAGAQGRYYDIDPREMPTMSVAIDSAIVDDVDYGQWQFVAQPVAGGTQLKNISATVRGASVSGNLDWFYKASGGNNHFIGSIETNDVASMLKQWDMPPSLESDSFRSLVDLSWPGTPLDMDYLNLQGSASVEVGQSRFPKTDSKTSALRVLGVFNLSTVSRRMRLDFTDLYKKGLSCDRIGGDFQFDGPLLTTANLIIKSPSAEFRIKGQVDMEKETLDHHMAVTLPVSSNLYVGCLAGPAACAGIFVVERLWGSKLEKMTTLGYHVSGSWTDPKVEEVQGMFERKK